jgi:hypothetical protein
MAYELLGKNFTPPDLHAKVTGKAKYAEDVRVDGMVFVKLLTSPMPHARVTSIDASAALAMPGVHGVLTPDEVEAPPAPQETILTNEPLFVGHPILALAADTEELASDALELIKVTYEELPFTVDPLQSLFTGGPNARSDGNVANQGVDLRTFKWTAQDFAAAGESQLPVRAAHGIDTRARLSFEDRKGRHIYYMTKPEISIGRLDGPDSAVDVPLDTLPDVSREHACIRYNEAEGTFAIRDLSRFGVTVNGQAIQTLSEKDWHPLPDKAELGLADVLFITFEVL